MPIAEPHPVWCERCEEKMDVLGESYTGERDVNGSGIISNKRQWFVIHKCKKCKAYKDIPTGGE